MGENNNGALADVAAAAGYGGRGYGGGFGFDGGYWMFFLFILLAMFAGGGWGNGFGGGGNMYGAVPYIGQQADMQRGFDQQAVMGKLDSLGTAVSNGFHQAEVAECNRSMNLMNTLNQMMMNNVQSFNSLGMAGVQGFNDVRSGLADNKFTFAQEECATRQTINMGFRDVLENNNMNTQRIVDNQNQAAQKVYDKLCQLEMDGYKQRLEAAQAEIGRLQTQLNISDRERSQTAQTAQIIANAQAQAQYVVNSCCPKAVPAYEVPNPNACGCNGFSGCGCGN